MNKHFLLAQLGRFFRLNPDKEILNTLGVIVGRFQSPVLTEAHKQLIRSVASRHRHVAIIIGRSPKNPDSVDPLSVTMRAQMIESEFPFVDIDFINDTRHDDVWDKDLDATIQGLMKQAHDTALIYGSRDNSLGNYRGKYSVAVLPSYNSLISGTTLRYEASREEIDHKFFRAGVIYACTNRYPICYPAVNVAILSDNRTQLLLGRKKGETLFRFIGGFAEPNSLSFEEDAKREVQEETGLEVGNIEYVASRYIDDWRYARSGDKIKTLFFTADRIFGAAKAADDIEEVKYFSLATVEAEMLVKGHRPLFELLMKKLVKSA